MQNLFFGTLNREISEGRDFLSNKKRHENKNLKNLYRYEDMFTPVGREEIKELFGQVPFLNCALFECLDVLECKKLKQLETIEHDGFNNEDAKTNGKTQFKRRAFVPNKFFFARGNAETHGNAKHQGLLEIFKQYDFTTDENSPNDADVSLDPELLGRVFENLLASVVDETKESARNNTGSFYTPREIVNYMVDEALLEYLKQKCEAITAKKIEAVFAGTEDDQHFDSREREKIQAALENMKILDPACGSGAFPMGCLSRIIDLLERIGVLPEGDRQQVYREKLKLIANCIYGVDIQPIATQISKLRFFISIICDVEYDKSVPAKNFGIEPLPALETKFVCANTLISADIEKVQKQDADQEFSFLQELENQKNQLLKIRRDYFTAKTFKEKAEAREREKAKREEIENELKNIVDKQYLESLQVKLAYEEENLKKYLPEKIERRKKQPQQPDFFVPAESVPADDLIDYEEFDANKEPRERKKREIAKLKEQIASAKNGSLGDKLVPAVRQLTEWDPYDQNQVAPFFNPDWMFGVPEGFDVVIGNPPYGAKVSDDEKKYYKENYRCAKTTREYRGSTDTFAIFIENGHDNLRKNGTLAFIVPMSVTSSDAMQALHQVIEEDCSTIKVSSYSNRPQQIFESAGLRVSIIQFLRDGKPCKHIFTTKLLRRSNCSIKNVIDQITFVNSFELKMPGRYAKAGTQIEVEILKKLFSSGTTIAAYKDENAKPFYYRTSGGRYWNVITNFQTGSSQEKPFNCKFYNLIGLILSGTIFYFYQQVYTDGLHIKQSEIEAFPLPDFARFSKAQIKKLEKLYEDYLADIERNANVRQTSQNSSLNVSSFKEYKIVKSKPIIDKIDDIVCKIYGLSDKETAFIKNYELDIRMSGSDDSVPAVENRVPAGTRSRKHRVPAESVPANPQDSDDE